MTSAKTFVHNQTLERTHLEGYVWRQGTWGNHTRQPELGKYQIKHENGLALVMCIDDGCVKCQWRYANIAGLLWDYWAVCCLVWKHCCDLIFAGDACWTRWVVCLSKAIDASMQTMLNTDTWQVLLFGNSCCPHFIAEWSNKRSLIKIYSSLRAAQYIKISQPDLERPMWVSRQIKYSKYTTSNPVQQKCKHAIVAHHSKLL